MKGNIKMARLKPIDDPDDDDGGLKPSGESGHSIANHSPVMKPASTGQNGGGQKSIDQDHGNPKTSTNSGSTGSEAPSDIPASWPAWSGPKLSPSGPEKPTKDSAPAQPEPETHHKKHHKHHHHHHKH
ncbi:hypothetical protein RF55_10244 [Lasius niger]|uniref:Uncharacterized protein n=1 Tax=Lasius niger TaxID=67767 RepID=A0A0J7KIG2_LASNI|nr:hypothetical protein RF55_10244 [Lasius niger]